MGYIGQMIRVQEKRKPSYPLGEIKKAFQDRDNVNRSMTAIDGANSLGCSSSGVINVVQSLSSKDFRKSMTSEWNHRIWQDVYHAEVTVQPPYVVVIPAKAGIQ